MPTYKVKFTNGEEQEIKADRIVHTSEKAITLRKGMSPAKTVAILPVEHVVYVMEIS